jgi:hypothetical protein
VRGGGLSGAGVSVGMEASRLPLEAEGKMSYPVKTISPGTAYQVHCT